MLKSAFFKYREENNDKKVNLKKCQEYLIDVLSSFLKFCSDNKIDFFLMWGTLLGAKREKGFIPWDDDIDIGVTEENYQTLWNNINKLSDYGLSYYHYTNIKHIYNNELRIYKKGFYKIVEDNDFYLTPVCIDIFVAKKISITNKKQITSIENRIKRIIHLLHLKEGRWKSSNKFTSFGRTLVRFLLNVIPERFLHERINRLSNMFYKEGLNFDVCFVETLRDSRIIKYDKTMFYNLDIAIFENLRVKIPSNSDMFLTNRYGDWKKPVDENCGKTIMEQFIIRL